MANLMQMYDKKSNYAGEKNTHSLRGYTEQ